MASGSGWLLGANGLVLAIALVQGVVVARSLGPVGFGVLSVVIALVTIVQQLFSSRVWEAATKFVVEFKAQGDPTRATAVVKLCYLVDGVAGVLGCVALVGLAEPAARLFVGNAAAAGPLRLFAFSTILAIPAATSSALLRLAGRFRWLAYGIAFEHIVRLSGVLFVIGLGAATLRGIVGAYLFAALLGAAGLVLMARPSARALGLETWSVAPLHLLGPDVRRILSFMFYSNLSGSTRLLTSRADVLVLGWLTDAQTVGVYRLARTISDPMSTLADPISHAAYPEMARLLHDGEGRAARDLSRRIRLIVSLVVMPVCIAVVLLAGWGIPLVFGVSYEGAVPLARILVWQLLWLPYVWLPGLLLSLDRARQMAAINGTDALAYVLLLLLLVPTFGAAGAAVATTLRFLIWTAMAAAAWRAAERDLVEMPS